MNSQEAEHVPKDKTNVLLHVRKTIKFLRKLLLGRFSAYLYITLFVLFLTGTGINYLAARTCVNGMSRFIGSPICLYKEKSWHPMRVLPPDKKSQEEPVLIHEATHWCSVKLEDVSIVFDWDHLATGCFILLLKYSDMPSTSDVAGKNNGIAGANNVKYSSSPGWVWENMSIIDLIRRVKLPPLSGSLQCPCKKRNIE